MLWRRYIQVLADILLCNYIFNLSSGWLIPRWLSVQRPSSEAFKKKKFIYVHALAEKRLFFSLLREDHLTAQTCSEKHLRWATGSSYLFLPCPWQQVRSCRHVTAHITEARNGPVHSSGCAHLHLESLTLCLFLSHALFLNRPQGQRASQCMWS